MHGVVHVPTPDTSYPSNSCVSAQSILSRMGRTLRPPRVGTQSVHLTQEVVYAGQRGTGCVQAVGHREGLSKTEEQSEGVSKAVDRGPEG